MVGTRSVDAMITPDQILFQAGGRCLELYGTPYRRTRPKTRGGEEVAQTFTRASTGSYIDRDGEVKLAESGLQRIDMVDLDGDGIRETPAFLLEDARTNGFTYSEQLDNGVWVKTRASCSGGAINATTAPDGNTTADKLVEDGTPSSTHVISRNTPALTNDTQQSWSVFAKAAERSEVMLRMDQKDGSQATAWFDLSAGTAGTTSDATSQIEAYGDGWYCCTLMADSTSGGATPAAYVYLGSGSETNSYNGDGSSGVYLWGVDFEVDKASPSSYIATAGSTVARAQEQMSFPFGGQPQAMTIYTRFVESGTIITGSNRLFQISTSDTDPRLIVYRNNGYLSYHGTTDGSVTSEVASAPSIGDTVELASQLKVDGSVQLHQSINGGSVSSATASSALALAAAWSGPTLWLNSISTSRVGFNKFMDVAAFAGVHPMADCRKALQQ